MSSIILNTGYYLKFDKEGFPLERYALRIEDKCRLEEGSEMYYYKNRKLKMFK